MKLVEIDRYESPWEAHIAAGRLEAEGIDPFVAHQYHIWAYWPLSLALGWVKIHVWEAEEEEARKLLEYHRTGYFQDLLLDWFPELDEEVCPECRGREIVKTLPVRERVLCMLLFPFDAIYPIRRSVFACANCSHVWNG